MNLYEDYVSKNLLKWDNWRQKLENEGRKNEDIVRNMIVEPILIKLGWDVSDPDIISPNFPLNGEYIDYVAFNKSNPMFIIEVKHIYENLNTINMLKYIEQAKDLNVNILIVTTGFEWRVYYNNDHQEFVYLSDIDLRFGVNKETDVRTAKFIENFSTAVFLDKANKTKLEHKLQESYRQNILPKALRDDRVVSLLASIMNCDSQEASRLIGTLPIKHHVQLNERTLNVIEEKTEPAIEKLILNMIGPASSSVRWRDTRSKYLPLFEKIWEQKKINHDTMKRFINSEMGQSTKGNGPFERENIQNNGATLFYKHGNDICINPKIENHFLEMLKLMRNNK